MEIFQKMHGEWVTQLRQEMSEFFRREIAQVPIPEMRLDNDTLEWMDSVEAQLQWLRGREKGRVTPDHTKVPLNPAPESTPLTTKTVPPCIELETNSPPPFGREEAPQTQATSTDPGEENFSNPSPCPSQVSHQASNVATSSSFMPVPMSAKPMTETPLPIHADFTAALMKVREKLGTQALGGATRPLRLSPHVATRPESLSPLEMTATRPLCLSPPMSQVASGVGIRQRESNPEAQPNILQATSSHGRGRGGIPPSWTLVPRFSPATRPERSGSQMGKCVPIHWEISHTPTRGNG